MKNNEVYLEEGDLPDLHDLIKSSKQIVCKNQCCSDIQQLLQNPEYLTKLISNSGSIYHYGRTYGDLVAEGSFSSCIRLESLGFPKSKYCKRNVNPYPITNLTSMGFLGSVYDCLPATCDVKSLNEWLSDVTYFPFKNNEYSQCFTNEISYKTEYIIGVVVIALWCLFILFCPWKKISFLHTVRKWSSIEQRESVMKSLHGIRVLSLMWVASGHTLMFSFYSLKTKNIFEVFSHFVEEHPLMNIWNNATFSVDSFFVIGGILTGYIFLKKFQNAKGESKIKVVFMAVLHRIIRLSPSIIVYSLIGALLYDTNSDIFDEKNYIPASVNLEPAIVFRACKDPAKLFETSFFLYFLGFRDSINDLTCLGHLWYLSCEFWYYLFSVVVLIFYVGSSKATKRHCRLALIALASMSIGWTTGIVIKNSFYFTMIILGVKEIPDGWEHSTAKADWTDQYYFLPWCRAAPYIVGVFAGLFLRNKNRKLDISKTFAVILWTFSVLIITFLVLGPSLLLTQGYEIPGWFNVIYEGFSRPLFGTALAIIIVLLETGHGWHFYSILASDWWLIFSKLNFGAYLTHILVICKLFGAPFPSDFYFTWEFGMVMSVYVCVAMYGTGFLYHVFLEVPLGEICNFLVNKLVK